MKKLILLTLILSSQAMAISLEVSKMNLEEDFQLKFKLSSDNQKDGHAILDCQSYFQKIDFYDKDDKIVSDNVISIGECEYIHDVIAQCLAANKDKCLDSEDVFNDSCECSN